MLVQMKTTNYIILYANGFVSSSWTEGDWKQNGNRENIVDEVKTGCS